MRVSILATEDIGIAAADLFVQTLKAKPTAAFGFATGSSPQSVYAELSHRVTRGEADFSSAIGFALDEYVGLPLGHPQSYERFVRERIEVPLLMKPGSIRVPDGNATDLDAAADAFDEAIWQAGGIDLQILGIGTNGHIGFNEPSSSLGSRTRVKTLALQTRRDNARFFDSFDDVPRKCVTQGLATIREAGHVVVTATGEAKASAVASMVEGPMTALVPASVLQLHRKVTVLVDEAAASELQLRDYYRQT